MLNDPWIGPASFAKFMLPTAHAATAKGRLHLSARPEGQAVLTHASTADRDKSFDLIIGGTMAAPPRGLFDILARQHRGTTPTDDGFSTGPASRPGGTLSYMPLPEPPMENNHPWNLIDWLQNPTDNGLGRISLDAGQRVLDEDVVPAADFMLRNILPGSSDWQSLMDAKAYSARTMDDLYAGRPAGALADLAYATLGVAGALPAIPNLARITRETGAALERGLSKLAHARAAQRVAEALSHLDEDVWPIRDLSAIGPGSNATADFLARHVLPAASGLRSLKDAGGYSQQMWEDIKAGRFVPALEDAGFMAASAAGALPLVPRLATLAGKVKGSGV